ncbi:hypothetical protein [Streptomyces xantholiticus]|uniref:hypothetical protein n=1 Tax=Streptomyces xantholiticus TaxID=68285 RepID=UPI00167560FB|nr:hypothetical protein [Streptomyces xantholiticus]
MATALACAAVDRGLSGVLLFDLDPALAAPLGAWLAALLPDSAGSTVLSAEALDDDLWVTVRPAAGAVGGFRPAPGPLYAAGRAPAVLVAPDLSRLGLAPSRAAITTLTADVAHLERDGQQAVWAPADRWVAGCPKHLVSRVSRHLLDRFALRIDGAALVPTPGQSDILGDVPVPWRQAVHSVHAGGPLPPLSAAAADCVVTVLPSAAAGTRRDLSLARTARALALLAGEGATSPHHVDRAASLLGLRSPSRPRQPVSPGVPTPDSISAPGGEAAHGASWPTARVPHQVQAGDGAAELPAHDVPQVPEGPYPEDSLADEREASPLRPPAFRPRDKTLRGHPVGTATTTTTRDLSLTATAQEAAKYQTLRCPGHHADGSHPLHLTAADLRVHRRATESSGLLVLVLDHTSRRELDWYPALSPYLSWAYTSRARVAVVEVGALDAPSELAASVFLSRSLLDRRVVQALNRPAGRATPLAHGLQLAGLLLRHETQHGGAVVDEAVLLVFTDGRANVPLEASRSLNTPAGVGDRGVRDAIEQAERIARLKRVRSVVLHPGPRAYAHLLTELAESLDGELLRADRAATDAG